jgi:hypothetical protein
VEAGDIIINADVGEEAPRNLGGLADLYGGCLFMFFMPVFMRKHANIGVEQVCR